MVEPLSVEQIRIELRKFVEGFRSDMMRKLCDVQSEAAAECALGNGASAAHLRTLTDKLEQSTVEVSLLCQQMSDFIDRR